MKKSIKVMMTILAVIMLLSTSSTISMAMNPTGIVSQLTGTSSSAQDDVVKIGNQIIGIITTVGVVVAVIVLLVYFS